MLRTLMFMALMSALLAAQERSAGGETLVSDKPGVYRVGGAVSAPRLIEHPQPEYTKKARKAKIEGTVTLSVTVDMKGVTTDIHVERSLTPDLDAAAITAIKQWRFQPARLNDKPVPVRVQIEIDFRLK